MSRHPTHLYQIDRQSAVAGLFWSSLERIDGSDRLKDLKRNAREHDARFGLIHQTTQNGESGIGVRAVGGLLLDTGVAAPTQAVSAAAWIAEARRDERLVFIDEVGHGTYWVVATSRGQIDLRADQLLDARTTIERVEAIVGDTYGTDDQYLVYVDWDAPLQSALLSRLATRPTRFAELVAGTSARPEWRLRQLLGITRTQVFATAAVVLIALVGLVAANLMQRVRAERQLSIEREQARLLQIEADRLQTLQEVRIAEAVATAVGEDTMTPDPDQLVRTCVAAYQRLGPRLGGWILESASCTPAGDALDLTYVQRNGLATNRSLSASATALGLTVDIDVQNGRAQARLPLTTPLLRDPLRLEQLPRWRELAIELPTRLQLLRRGGSITHAVVGAPSERPVAFRDPAKEGQTTAYSPVPASRGYRRGSVTMAASSLWALPRLSLDYPFVTVTKLELRPQGASVQWTLEASYVVGNS
jgi:hypothetical protein